MEFEIYAMSTHKYHFWQIVTTPSTAKKEPLFKLMKTQSAKQLSSRESAKIKKQRNLTAVNKICHNYLSTTSADSEHTNATLKYCMLYIKWRVPWLHHGISLWDC